MKMIAPRRIHCHRKVSALEEMAKKNDGKITCPRTGEVYNYKDLVKAYIS
ncbi:hypothetical protein RchiOBHm_Chr1g0364751 [Rosa chinensis]|uniref:Uncharacterized protein n=1 Tax=Rosa chinensis TaxID=74649 RepID=A0A2P6SJV7_ROSCH|nr:hypothetical protein RchiOBHm_Chr1g0364751 [Rosa chinensis]